MFDYEKYEEQCVGSVETGVHSLYDFYVYRIDGELLFWCTEDPEDTMTYEETKEFFIDCKGDHTLDKQLADQGITV